MNEITSTNTTENGNFIVGFEDGACVTFFEIGDEMKVHVVLNNAMQKAHGGFGKCFPSLKAALEHYKPGKNRDLILRAYAAKATPIQPTPKKKVSKTAITEATDSLNYRRRSVTGGTRDETRRQFEHGSGFHLLNLAATVENLIANPTARVDEWTLNHARESVERTRSWFARMEAEATPEPSAPTPEDRRAAFYVVAA